MTAPIPSAAFVSPARLDRWVRPVVFPVLLCAIITGFYWKLVLTYEFDWMWGPDLAEQVLPWFQEEARQMHHGRLPLWDTHVWDGQPLLAQGQPGAAYPLNWPVFLLPFQNGHINMLVMAWYYVAERWMAALFCYLLCRDLGRSRAASLIGGLVFALAAYVGNVDWPQMVNGAVWAPLVLMFILRVGRGDRPLASTALCGLCWGMSWLSGHHQAPIFITYAALFIWLYYICRAARQGWLPGERPEWRPALRVAMLAAIAIVIMALVGALQTLPANEYAHLAKRWAGALDVLGWDQAVPYYVHAQYSLHVWSLLGIVIPGQHQNTDPFLGVVALSLAVLGLATGWSHHGARVMAAVAAGGLVYALGSNSIFQGFLYAVLPLVDKARSPSMALVLFSVGVAVLAAFGADHVCQLLGSLWGRRVAIALLAFGLFLWALMLAMLFANRLSWPVDDRVGITALCATTFAGLLYARRTGNLGRVPANVLVVLLLLFELGNVTGYNFADRSDAGMRRYLNRAWSNPELAEYLNAQPKPFRVNIQDDALSPNWPEYYGLDGYVAYTASLTSDFQETDFHTPESKRLYGVRYSVGKQPDVPGAQSLYEGSNGVKVFDNPGAFPRAWAVHAIVPLKSRGEGRAFIHEHADELRRKALMLDRGPTLEACDQQEDVRFAQYLPERVFLQADMACAGMVVLSDNYYPGWRATVDGTPTPIYEVNLAMRGVFVPRGHHDVQFHYRPASVLAGGALTFCGVAGACLLAFFGRKRPGTIDFADETRNNTK